MSGDMVRLEQYVHTYSSMAVQKKELQKLVTLCSEKNSAGISAIKKKGGGGAGLGEMQNHSEKS